MTETKIISETGMIDMDPKRTIIGGQRRRGIMLVLSSPSGAGKTSIAHELLERNPHIVRSISATTRQRRPEEVDGVDYTFMDREKFSLLLLKDQFLEHAKVFGHYYGTPKGPVDDHLAAGRDVIFVIDWQGAQQLTINAREDVVSVFILPPTRKELLERLQKRAQDSDEVIARRMTESPDEIAHWHEYDYTVVNDDLEETVGIVQAIVSVERLRRHRQLALEPFVDVLLEEKVRLQLPGFVQV